MAGEVEDVDDAMKHRDSLVDDLAKRWLAVDAGGERGDKELEAAEPCAVASWNVI